LNHTVNYRKYTTSKVSHLLPSDCDEVSSGRPDVASSGSVSSEVSLIFCSSSTTGSSSTFSASSDSLFSSSSAAEVSFLGNASSVSFFAASEIYNVHIIYRPNAQTPRGSQHVMYEGPDP
jgi:hypothetical protein